MICRTWHGWATPRNADAYERLLRGAAGGPGVAVAVRRAVGALRGASSRSGARGGRAIRGGLTAGHAPLRQTAALVAGVDAGTLALRDLPRRNALRGGASIPLPAIAYLEVRRGRRRSFGWTLVGSVLGLAGGAIVGGFTGVALECGRSCRDEGEFGGLVGVVVGSGVGALAGAITGGVIGARRRPRWVPVTLPAR